MLPAIRAVLENVQDPRLNRTRRHSLTAILARALCAVLCGADSWGQIEV